MPPEETISTKGEPETPAPKIEEEPKPAEPTWRDTLPDDLKGSKSLEDFKDVPGLAKSYVELKKHSGGTVKMPQTTDGVEVWNSFYTKLGRPEASKDYQLDGIDKLEEADVTKFKDSMFGIGLSQHQAAGVIKHFTEVVVPRLAEDRWTQERGQAAIQQVWKTPEELAEKSSLAQRAARRLGHEFGEMLDETSVGNHPTMLKFLAEYESSHKEDDGPGGVTGIDSSGREAPKTKIAEIKNDKNHPYHKGDREATAEMTELYKTAAGGSGRVLLEVG